MDIYELLSKGMSLEEIETRFKAEMAAAAARAEEERKAEVQAKEEKQAKVESLKCEARAHLVNAIFAYGEAYGFIDEADINDTKAEELAEMLAEAETQVEELIPLLKSLESLKQEQKAKPEKKRIIKIKQELDPMDANKILRDFLDGLL